MSLRTKKETAGIRKDIEKTNDKKLVRISFLDNRIFYNCGNCGKVISFKRKKHMKSCIHCGHVLDWSDAMAFDACSVIAQNADEARYLTECYRSINGETYGLDPDKWYSKRKSYPLELYFPFIDHRNYGKFMRTVSKEGLKVF